MNTAIAEYDPIATALASVEKYRGLVCDVTTAKGLAEAKAAHKEVAALRIALEKTRKKVKEDVVARGKLIDGEANRIFALIAAIEDPIKTQIDAEERRAQEAREAAIRAEAERLAAEEKARKDAEEAKLAAERAEIARQRAELDRAAAAQAEADRKARQAIEDAERAARQKIEDEQRAADAARAAADRAAREAREAEEAKLKAAREAEEARLKDEREALDAEKRAADEAKRKEEAAREAEAKAIRDAEEAKAREQQRQANELLDGRQLLETFRDRFGHRPEFSGVVSAISAYLHQHRKAA